MIPLIKKQVISFAKCQTKKLSILTIYFIFFMYFKIKLILVLAGLHFLIKSHIIDLL